jgi:AraC family transcriptional regulator of arabinose operon
MDWLPWQPGIRLFQAPQGGLRKEAEEAMRRVIRFSGRSGREADTLAFLALEEIFVLARPDAREIDFRIQRAVDHLNRHYQRPFVLQEVAGIAGLSVSRFSDLFRRQVGTSPRAYGESVRLEHAASLLKLTQLQVGEVAACCGYEDALYFSKCFRRRFGRPPQDYRQA